MLRLRYRLPFYLGALLLLGVTPMLAQTGPTIQLTVGGKYPWAITEMIGWLAGIVLPSVTIRMAPLQNHMPPSVTIKAGTRR